uniref:Gamma-glutamylcyclotransferase AIG2-like domain-containing protein n=1 Tax=Caldiarchaeum subterraneum TaxID=311458 RepID=E6NA88_CALS0|nr:conserved hypothetical protein [Candidatus Caldarchaeum subterraneum]
MAVWYFAYGSNLDQEGMRRRVGEWFDLKPAILRDYKLVFNVFSSSWRGGVANIEESPGSVVYGAVYLLEESQLEKLDKYEGVPHLYHRRKMTVEVGGRPLEAYVYVATNPRPRLTPSSSYLALVLKGLKKLGYSDDVIHSIRMQVER